MNPIESLTLLIGSLKDLAILLLPVVVINLDLNLYHPFLEIKKIFIDENENHENMKTHRRGFDVYRLARAPKEKLIPSGIPLSYKIGV